MERQQQGLRFDPPLTLIDRRRRYPANGITG